MTTPRIEEYGEWDIEVDGVKYAGKRSLTEAHQAGIRDAIEFVLKEYGYMNDGCGCCMNERLDTVLTVDDTIKALQNDK